MFELTSDFRIKIKFATIVKYFVLIIIALINLFPFLWVFLSSFKNSQEIYAAAFSIPKIWRFGNYSYAWTNANMGRYFLNSVLVSTVSVSCTLLFSAMAGYVLARIYKSTLLYLYYTIGIMIPIQIIIIPSFIMLKNIGLINTQLGLIIMYIVSNLSLAIFIITGFMKSIPKEMEESATIEGAGRTKIFFIIILPLSLPGLATVGILSFLSCWNEYLFAYILISTSSLKVLTQGIMALKGLYLTNYGVLCASLMITIIPIIVVYIIFQEQIVKGMFVGAVKG